MHFVLGALVILLEASFVIHAIKTRRENWIYLIILVPAVGCLVYFVMEVLPEMRYSRTGRQATSSVARVVAQSNNVKKLQEQLELLDTVQNRQLLAREYVRVGQYAEGIDLYKSCLTGLYETDPQMMLELAEAYFLAGQYSDAKDVFLRLGEANPAFKSAEGHLLYARTLENLDEHEDALQEYEIVSRYYPGEEANCRYATLLKTSGQTDKANEIFNQILLRSRNRKGPNKNREKQWVEIARQNLQESAT